MFARWGSGSGSRSDTEGATRRPATSLARVAALTLATGISLSCTPTGVAVDAMLPSSLRVIAQRGASAYAPENTLPAFEFARDLGVLEVELSVQLSKDDVVVLFHDATLDEKTQRSGAVRDYTVAELREADIGRWFDRVHPEAGTKHAGTTLVSLADLLALTGDALYYHVELRSGESELPRLVLLALAGAGLSDQAMIASLALEPLIRVRSLDRNMPTCLLLRGGSLAGIDRAAAASFDEVGISARDLDARFVAYARARGLAVRALATEGDGSADVERAIRLGADGVSSERPDRLIARMVGGPGEPPRR